MLPGDCLLPFGAILMPSRCNSPNASFPRSRRLLHAASYGDPARLMRWIVPRLINPFRRSAFMQAALPARNRLYLLKPVLVRFPGVMVREGRLELPFCCQSWILSPVRLPIPPLSHRTFGCYIRYESPSLIGALVSDFQLLYPT